MAFEIIQIPHDDAGIRSYVEQYKTFRLLSLKTSPASFGSNYAREVAFTDDIWWDRLANPKATTFIAVQSDRVVCTLTTIGPLPTTAQELSPLANPWDKIQGTDDRPLTQYHVRINGMFTLPEARGQGVAKALLDRVIKDGTAEAAKVGLIFTASMVVEKDNPAARALYAKCGFVETGEEPFEPCPETGRPRIAMLMIYVLKTKE